MVTMTGGPNTIRVMLIKQFDKKANELCFNAAYILECYENDKLHNLKHYR